MQRFARAYARALFPRGAQVGAGRTPEDDGRSVALTADGLDLAIGGSVYRLVRAVEGLLDRLRQRPRHAPDSAVGIPTARRVGCG
jgi:hypothetical protein